MNLLWRDFRKYAVELFFFRKGARSCSMVGATFWRGLGLVDMRPLLPEVVTV